MISFSNIHKQYGKQLIFVDASFRGRGIGAALFDASLVYATSHGYARLDWVTAEDNVDAQRFYDRHGGRRGPWISYSAVPQPRQSRGSL